MTKRTLHIDQAFYLSDKEIQDKFGLDYFNNNPNRLGLCGKPTTNAHLWPCDKNDDVVAVINGVWPYNNQPNCETCIILYLVEIPKALKHLKERQHVSH